MNRDLPKGVLRRKGTDLLYIRYYVDGADGKRVQKQEPAKTTDPKQAEKLLRQRLVDTERGAVAPADVNQITYDEIKEIYLRSKPNQATYNGWKDLDPYFKGKKFKNITADVLQDYVEFQREERERPLAEPTIGRQMRCLKAMFNKARKDGRLGMRDIPNFPHLKDSEPAGQYIEPEQFQRILDALDKIREEKMEANKKDKFDDLKPFFSFMYATGCRLTAAMSITWGMISGKDRDVINLPGSIMKTKKPLLLVLDGALLAPIAKSLRSMFKRDDSEKIFDCANYRQEWAKACALAGVGTWNPLDRTRTGVRIHDCRCSGAINLLDAGVDESTVLKIGGWKTRAMLDRYNVQNEKRIRAAMQRGGEYVVGKMAGGQA
jgi:integrase